MASKSDGDVVGPVQRVQGSPPCASAVSENHAQRYSSAEARPQGGGLLYLRNFRLLHGRDRLLGVPRTRVGKILPEQVVHDRYRALQIDSLKQHVDEG